MKGSDQFLCVSLRGGSGGLTQGTFEHDMVPFCVDNVDDQCPFVDCAKGCHVDRISPSEPGRPHSVGKIDLLWVLRDVNAVTEYQISARCHRLDAPVVKPFFYQAGNSIPNTDWKRRRRRQTRRPN